MKTFIETLSCILFMFVCACLCSCGGNTSKEQNSGNQSVSVSADVVGEVAPTDSVTSEYLKEAIHSGRKVLLNFCFCCDCKITAPVAQKAIEKLGFPVTMVMVDVKEHFDLADEYGIMRTPFYMLFNETGKMLDTLYGYKGKDMIEAEDMRRWLAASVNDKGRRTE